jgi:hypothetical protein
MNKLSRPSRAQIIRRLVEGNSMRSTSRIADVSINTVTKLLIDACKVCSDYQDQALRDLPCKRLQLDEIWAFCYAKQRKVPFAKAAPEEAGDIWTWVAIDAETKIVPSWRVGDRSGDTAIEFVCDLSKRLANRVQVTSDGHRAYIEAVEAGFGADVDYAQLINSTVKCPVLLADTAPHRSTGLRRSAAAAIPIPNTSPPAMSSGRT